MSSAEGFDLDGFLPYRLSVASNRVSRLFAGRYSAEFGLSIPEWRVLAVLGRHPGATASDVGERTGMDKAKVSRAVAALEARGLLARGRGAGDRRLQPLAMTGEGARIHADMVPRALALEAELAAVLAPAEAAALRAALRRIEDRARELGAGEEPGGPD